MNPAPRVTTAPAAPAARVTAAPSGPASKDRRQSLVWAAVALMLIALAELAQAWHSLRADFLRFGGFDDNARNALCSVLLVNGQMYYGTLEGVHDGVVRLSDVYYVRTAAPATGGTANNQLVSRRKTDWHAPEWMAIPTDKVLMIERVGAASQVATLIAQDHGTAGTQAPRE